MPRARTIARWGVLPVIFGLGVVVGRGASTAAESSLIPVTGVARAADTTRSARPEISDETASGKGSALDDARAVAHDDAPAVPAARGAHKRSQSRAQALAAGEPQPKSWSEVASQGQRGTVGILAGDRYGAGIIVDRSGLVLTNLHVIQGIDKVSALLLGDETLDAVRVAEAAELDLALLRLPRALPEAAELGSAKSVHLGDEVLAVGSPRKMFFSVSRGMVSYSNRKLDGVEYLQTDLPINAGNSGGPLLDRGGKVIGVVSFILRDSQGIAFALPIDYALERFSAQLQAEPGAALGPRPPDSSSGVMPRAGENSARAR